MEDPEVKAAPEFTPPEAAQTNSSYDHQYSNSNNASPAPTNGVQIAAPTEPVGGDSSRQASPSKTIKNLIALAKVDRVEALARALESTTIRQFRRLRAKDNGAYQLAMVSLREAGIKVKDIERVEKAVNAAQQQHSPTAQAGLARRLNTGLLDAPDADGLMVPLPWEANSGGIYHTTVSSAGRRNTTRKGMRPFYISGRLIDQETGEHSLRLTWKDGDAWRHRIVSRETAMRVNLLLSLTQFGFPASSQDGKPLISYLQAFENENMCRLLTARTSGRLGWLKDGSGFLAGQTFITARGKVDASLDPDVSPSLWPELGFHGVDKGDEQLAQAFHSAGTLEGWLKAMLMVRVYPRVMLVIYAAFVPPLLAMLGSANFGLDLCGPTSGGKTTTMMLAGSVWGDVRIASDSRVWSNWNATEVSLERRLAVLNSLPFILDDTKQADPARVARMLYNVVAGTTRGRGTAKIGQAASLVSNTVLLSTGEGPLVAFSQDGGTRARVLTLWGAPFEKTNSETSKLVSAVREAVQRNYGQAGPKFIEFLLANQNRWPQWREDYHRTQSAYRKRAAGNPVVDRQAPYAAAIALAAQLVDEALGLPWEYTDPVEPLWNILMAEAAEADRAEAAWQETASWVDANRQWFEGPHQNRDFEGRPRPPSDGWLGRWDNAGKWVAVRPPRLRKELERWGYNADATLRTWQDRGWLLTDKDRRTKKIRCQGGNTQMVVLRLDHLVGEAASGAAGGDTGDDLGTEESE